MKKFIVDKYIYAIIPNDNGCSLLSENGLIETNFSTKCIINRNCLYYGSSFIGRVSSAKSILGVSYKVPIVLCETFKIIMFPTSSFKDNRCCWINIFYVDNFFEKLDGSCDICFCNGSRINVKISKFILNQQIFKSSRLLNIINSRYFI